MTKKRDFAKVADVCSETPEQGAQGSDLDAARRRLHRAYYEACERHYAERERLETEGEAGALDHLMRTGVYPSAELPPLPAFPEAIQGLTCGAKTRAGTPCKQLGLFLSGRCKLHGGMSTGPTSAEGKAKAAQNGAQPKRKRSP